MNRLRKSACIRLLIWSAFIGAGLPGSAVTYIVTSNDDSGPGSLRQAVEDSNWSLGSNHIIITTFGPITLASELAISNSARITGVGASTLTIQANHAGRIFRIADAGLLLEDMTIARGSNAVGGAILLESGTLNLVRCRLTDNKAVNGGAIAQLHGTLTITDSTISSNSATGTGMGVYIAGNSTAIVRRSTLVGNSGTGLASGGGITHAGTSLTLENCTLHANGSATGQGGGLLNSSGNAAITNCTFVKNVCSVGGGIAVIEGSVAVRNSVLAQSTATGDAPDCYGPVISGGFNLVGDASNSTGWGAQGDLVGTSGGPINPMLGPLQDNGGFTWTMAPLFDSPVVDRGHSSGIATDQRGESRPFNQPQVPNAVAGDGADIGAFESHPMLLVVSTTNDFGPGSLRQALLDADVQGLTQIDFAEEIGGNLIALTNELVLNKNLIIRGPGRSALALEAAPGTRAIHATGGNSTLSGLTIRNCQVTGIIGAFETIGHDAHGGAILNEPFSTLHLQDLVVSNNIVTGGKGGPTENGIAGEGGWGHGGGIANFGLLSLTRCVLANNFATGGDGGEATGSGVAGVGGLGFGGSIYNEGSAFLTNCCVHSSVASGGNGSDIGGSSGGGIYNFTNLLSLFTCTVASNRAVFGYGGGICDFGSNGVYRSSTIAGNQGAFAGGIFASGSDFGNTLIGANVGNVGPDVNGTLFSSDYNLIQRTNSAVITGETSHTLRFSPFLGPLQDNGGPTPTMPLLPGSPAIDMGKSFGITTDQRGRRRPFYFGPFHLPPGGDASDIGAYESLGAFLRIARSGTNAVLSWPTNEPSLKLQSAPFLNPYGPGLWSDVPGTRSVSGNQFIMLDPLKEKKFYRLLGF